MKFTRMADQLLIKWKWQTNLVVVVGPMDFGIASLILQLAA